MKKLFLSFLIITSIHSLNAQTEAEKDIRKLDSLDAITFMKNDIVALEKLWDVNFVVTNPFNMVVKLPQIKALMQNQKITQVPFVRVIENIGFNKNIAIVMGTETPDEKMAATGVPKSVLAKRRFTNIWMKKEEGWKLVARQASNI
jgi:uncharacterized protein (DUF2384 family)